MRKHIFIFVQLFFLICFGYLSDFAQNNKINAFNIKSHNKNQKFAYLTQKQTKAQAIKKILPSPTHINGEHYVVVKVIINKKGQVSSAKIIKGLPVLAYASELAAKQWKFKPLVRKGKSLKMIGTIVFTYTKSRVTI